jgi:hypothetical protein
VDTGAGRVLLAGFAQHHQGIPDADISVVDAAVWAQGASLLDGAEDFDQEVDQAVSVVGHDVGVDAVQRVAKTICSLWDGQPRRCPPKSSPGWPPAWPI